MSFERTYKQDITYWAASGKNGYGATTFAAPVSFKGRWEDHQEQMKNNSGESIMSKARVFVPDVIELPMDGYLFLGVSVATDPSSVAGAYEIVKAMRIPNLRNLMSNNVAVLA